MEHILTKVRMIYNKMLQIYFLNVISLNHADLHDFYININIGMHMFFSLTYML